MTGFIFFCLGRICFLGLHNLQDYIPGREGGGDTPLPEANRDVPLDGVAFSRLE